MPKTTTLFVGLDVHKDFISVAHAQGQCTGPPVFVGSIRSRQADVEKLVRRVHSKTARIVFSNGAGLSGHVLHRYLTARGLECLVVAPPLIPKRPGEGVKTAAEARPCHDATLGSVMGRLRPTLVPRVRKASDGTKYGGNQPTDISRINRRQYWPRLYPDPHSPRESLNEGKTSKTTPS